MNFNEYFRDSEVQTSTIKKKKFSPSVFKALGLIFSTELFKYAIPFHFFLQVFIEYYGVFTTFSVQNDSRICHSAYEFSSLTREVTIFILGAFVITAALYIVRMSITIGNAGAEGMDSTHLWSYSKAFVIAIMPVISMSSVVYSNWGGTCVDSFG